MQRRGRFSLPPIGEESRDRDTSGDSDDGTEADGSEEEKETAATCSRLTLHTDDERHKETV